MFQSSILTLLTSPATLCHTLLEVVKVEGKVSASPDFFYSKQLFDRRLEWYSSGHKFRTLVKFYLNKSYFTHSYNVSVKLDIN